MPPTNFPSHEYRDWNRRLLDYCLTHSVGADGRVFLTIEPFLEAQPELDAEEQFITAVRRNVLNALPTWGDNLINAFRGYDSIYPLCAALLGVTVLAASEMEDLAYYEHLRNYLQIPDDLTRRIFGESRPDETPLETAWHRLRDYFAKHRAILPDPPDKGKRYVKLPKQHALLRKIDIRRLADFFYNYNISPRYYYSEATLRQHFSSWMRNNPLTSCGMTAWNDIGRRDAVLGQVVEALSSWDEEGYRTWRTISDHDRRYSVTTDDENRRLRNREGDERRFDRIRRVPVHLYLELGEDEEPAKLFFRLTIHDGLPDKVPFAGGHFLRRGGTYTMLQVADETSQILDMGYENAPFDDQYAQNGESAILSFKSYGKNSSNSAFIFVQDDWGGDYMQTDSLQIGIPGAILVKRTYASTVRSWVPSRSALKEVSLGKHLDKQWALITGIEPSRATASPAQLARLHISTNLLLRLKGGLRLDKSQDIWMSEAPPTPVFVGKPLPSRAIVGDLELPVQPDGRVVTSLRSAGKYRIAGISDSSSPVQRWVQLEDPRLIKREGDDKSLSTLFGNYLIPLPARISTIPEVSVPIITSDVGDATSDKADRVICDSKVWWLLGTTPGNVRRMLVGEMISSARIAGREAMWAVGFGSGGVLVLHVGTHGSVSRPQPPKIVSAYARRLWFDLIVRASSLPCLECSSILTRGNTVALWQAFVRQAYGLRAEVASSLTQNMSEGGNRAT